MTDREQLFIDRLVDLGREYHGRGQQREFADVLANFEATIEGRLADEALQGIKATLLAPDIDVCRALLRGERIPWQRLDYFQAQRYGLKQRHADGRYALDDFNDFRAPATT